ncbi:MAG TPA: glycerate-2-kinase family protein, partial [Candidatus Aminicenantes bacterium]|nr:glycerate-2-kinase family protein [Candidatus Aminicenantes bacterium]
MPPPPASSDGPGPRAGAILAAALLAVDGEEAVRRTLVEEGRRLHLPGETLDLSRFSAVHLLGAGKCAPEMAAGAWSALPIGPAGGVIVGPKGKAFSRSGIEYWPGGHPLPDEGSLAAGRAMFDYVTRRIDPADLVVFLLSGGASALLALPRPGISLRDKVALTRRLLALGVPIEEVNAVRRELSRIKGGKLAAAVPGAALLTLILDDIPGGDPAAVGSGPTLPPPPGTPSARR